MKITNPMSGVQVPALFPNKNKNTMPPQRGAANSVVSKMKEALESRKKNRVQPKTAGLQVSTYVDKDGNVHRTYTGTSVSVVDTMKKYAEKKKAEEKKSKKKLHYSYNKVSSQIVSAKNSVSAEKAVLAARRGLLELKRKIRSADCSEDEKQAALAHANQMLRIAKKKKKNLEMEELVQTTMKSDEWKEKVSEQVEPSAFKEEVEEEMAEESENAEELQEMDLEAEDAETDNFEEELTEENFEEVSREIQDALMEDTENALADELFMFDEDLLADLEEQLEEELDLMDMMEVVNPHMDKEAFERLKTKHRSEEQKELVKADMEYLKAYLKCLQEGSGAPRTESMGEFAPASTGAAEGMRSPTDFMQTSLGFECSL